MICELFLSRTQQVDLPISWRRWTVKHCKVTFQQDVLGKWCSSLGNVYIDADSDCRCLAPGSASNIFNNHTTTDRYNIKLDLCDPTYCTTSTFWRYICIMILPAFHFHSSHRFVIYLRIIKFVWFNFGAVASGSANPKYCSPAPLSTSVSQECNEREGRDARKWHSHLPLVLFSTFCMVDSSIWPCASVGVGRGRSFIHLADRFLTIIPAACIITA